MRAGVFALVLALAGSLAACQRGADTGAGSNPNALGSPGTGNAARSVAPQAPDGPPGGPSGVAGSAAHSGASGAAAVPGTSGKGGSAQGAPPGSGLHGGLGATDGSTRAMGAGPNQVPPGSTNRTPSESVGRR